MIGDDSLNENEPRNIQSDGTSSGKELNNPGALQPQSRSGFEARFVEQEQE